MSSSRTRTGLFETLPRSSDSALKASPKIKTSNKPEIDPSSSPLESSSKYDNFPRVADLRPKFGEPKPLERRQTKVPTPEKLFGKGTESQALQEDLKKTKELLEKLVDEKWRAVEEMNAARRAVEETNEKLNEAISLQKKAEENCVMEKFRADELEQASIDSIHKIQSEINLIKKQRADDASALLFAVQERDKMKQELAMITEAKIAALHHAETAMKIAEDNAEKVKTLSLELAQTRMELDEARASHFSACEEKASTDSIWDSKLKESSKLVDTLDSEVKLVRARLLEAESVMEELRHELAEANKKVELLEVESEKAKSNEKEANENVASLLKQLEESNRFLKEAESEIASLKGSMESLEESLGKHRCDLEISGQQMELAKLEADSMSKTIKSLQMKIERMEEEKTRSDENESMTTSRFKILIEEKSKLSDDLQVSRDQEQKRKIEVDNLTLSFHNASMEANKAKEDLATTQVQLAEIKSQMQVLQLSLRTEEEKHKIMIAKSNEETDYYKVIAEKNCLLLESSKAVWDEKESNFLSCLKRSEEDIKTLKGQLSQMSDSLKNVDSESKIAREDSVRLQNCVENLKSELSNAKQVVERDKSLGIELREILDAKENELQRITREHNELEERHGAAQEKIEELLYLLADKALQKVEADEDGIQLQKSLNQFKYELASARQTAELAASESLMWKEISKQKGTDLGRVNQENRELRARESASMEKVEELSNRFEEETLHKAKEYCARLQASLDEVKSELSSVKQYADSTTCESLALKETLGVKENELARISEEYKELQLREAAALNKVETLSKLLEEKRKVEEDRIQLQISLGEVQSQLSSAIEVADQAISESLRFQEIAVEKENQLSKTNQENKELRDREAVALEEINKLKLLVGKDLQKQDKDENLGKDMGSTQQKAESSYGAPNKKFHEKSVSFPSFSTLAEEYDQPKFKSEHSDRKKAKSVEVQEGVSTEGVDTAVVQKQHKKKNSILLKFGSLLKKKHSQK